jgi:hypothetical protein
LKQAWCSAPNGSFGSKAGALLVDDGCRLWSPLIGNPPFPYRPSSVVWQGANESGGHTGERQSSLGFAKLRSFIAILQTRDNQLLSRSTNEARQGQSSASAAQVAAEKQSRAINCTNGLADEVSTYVRAGIAAATRRAYRADMEHFHSWGGKVPETEERLARYLAAHATKLKVATLIRRLAAISVAHEGHGLTNPVRSPLIRAVVRGIRRQHGTSQRQGRPLLRDDLFAVLATIGGSPKDIRDRALLLIGFAGGFRRSELVAIDFADVERVRQGVILRCAGQKLTKKASAAKSASP